MTNPQFNTSRLSPIIEYIKKQKDIEKNSHMIEIGVTFFIISFFLFFAIKPTVLTISSLVGDISSKNILTQKMKTKIDQVITAQDNFSQIQEKYFLVEEALPSSQNYVETINQILSISSPNNIFFDKIVFAQSDKNYFSTQISTSSSFSSGINFLASIFQSRRLINTSQISFTQTQETQESGKIMFSFPLDIYYWQNQNEKK